MKKLLNRECPMKKELTLVALSMALGSTLQASDWRQQLVSLNPGVIDSVSVLSKDVNSSDLCHSYMIHYHQPLQHDTPELGDLPLRALLTLRNEEDFTDLMMQMYIGGYQLDEVLVKSPDEYFDSELNSAVAEVAGRYGGNLLQPEHRYFGESCPENPWESLGYCEAKEAAADFHALVQAMKKVFTGKWAITGISKGGITTTMQHAFYPDDADCYVPYSGPFLGYYHDLRMQDRYMTYSWAPEQNEKMLHLQRRMTGSEELFGYFCMANGLDPEVGANEPEVLCSFALAAASIDQSPRAYSSRELVDEIFAYNENKLQQMGLEDYSTEMMLYMILNDRVLIDQEFFDWYQRNFVTEGTANGPRHARLKEDVKLEYKHKLLLPVFGVDEEIWNQDPTLAYSYQAAHELGYFDMRFDYYFDDPEDADMVNAMWMNLYNNVLEAEMGEVYAGVEYSPELFTFVRQQTAQAEKPILFIYGGDDIWTGAHMEDEHVNADNVRLYVLPEQNHRASISAVTDTSLQNELWAFTDAVFSNTVGITQLSDDASAPARYYDLYGRRVSEKALQGKVVVKR